MHILNICATAFFLSYHRNAPPPGTRFPVPQCSSLVSFPVLSPSAQKLLLPTCHWDVAIFQLITCRSTKVLRGHSACHPFWGRCSPRDVKSPVLLPTLTYFLSIIGETLWVVIWKNEAESFQRLWFYQQKSDHLKNQNGNKMPGCMTKEREPTCSGRGEEGPWMCTRICSL